MCEVCNRRRLNELKRLRRQDPAVKVREAAQRRTHYEAHREQVLERGRRWSASNPDRKRELFAAWYAEHRSDVLEQRADQAARARIQARVNADRAANPEKYRARDRRQRQGNEQFALRNRENSRRRQTGTAYSRILYSAVLERDGMVCHLCGDPIPSLNDLHFDHVIPLAKGGEHTVENVKPAHALCNMRKGDRLI